MFLWLAFFTSLMSFAYIPEYSLIASRTAENHGRGAYQIEQEVTYKKEGESLTVKETWSVASETSMRVTLEGRGPLKGLVSGTIIYDGGNKYFADSNAGTIKSQRQGDEWLEPLFHFRYNKYLRQRLVNLKVTPASAMNDRPALNADGDPGYQPPSFIRLSRVGGGTAYAIGPNPASGSGPTLWIEQDQFVVRKFRGSNQAVIKADDYFKADESFYYPRTRTYQMGSYTVTVLTSQVKSLGKLNAQDNRFRTASLNPTKDALKLPDSDGLREFYLRFR